MNYGDPKSKNYSRRGLVMGDVQSGKTNYIGLAARAADAG